MDLTYALKCRLDLGNEKGGGQELLTPEVSQRR